MAGSMMQGAKAQTERTLESGVPNHKVYAMSGTLPGEGDMFGCSPLSAMQGRTAEMDAKRKPVADRARATAPPARNGSGLSQSDADHGPAD